MLDTDRAEQPRSMTERAVSVVRTLVESHEAGQPLSDQSMLDYRSQCDQTEHGIAELRAMVNAYGNEFRVH